MAWFSRKSDDASSADTGPTIAATIAESAPPVPDDLGEDALVVPRQRALPPAVREAVSRRLEQVVAAGVDVDDIASIGAAYDGWLASWLAEKESQRPDHLSLVEQIAVAVGEHLVRHTDVEWGMVTDAFGTDLGVAARTDDFTVVPTNLVAVRWLNRTSGWIPGVVGHLVALRTTMK